MAGNAAIRESSPGETGRCRPAPEFKGTSADARGILAVFGHVVAVVEGWSAGLYVAGAVYCQPASDRDP